MTTRANTGDTLQGKQFGVYTPAPKSPPIEYRECKTCGNDDSRNSRMLSEHIEMAHLSTQHWNKVQ